MQLEFTPEQISQIVRAARVLCHGFTEEQLQWLIDCQHRLTDSAFCEVAWGVARLERERGISCANVLDACEQLQQEKAELEAEVARVEEKLQAQQKASQESEKKYHQMTEAAGQAKRELTETKTEKEREERKLAAYRKKTDKEKERIDHEVEEHRQKANITEREVDAAAELKAQVGSCGFSLEQMLGISQEFSGYENIKDEVATALKLGLTLAGYNNQAEQRKKALETDVKNLELSRLNLESNLSQLRADASFEDKLRRFYHRYQNASVLMEQLATWKEIYFVGCGNPTYAATKLLDRFTKGARFWTEKPPAPRCACCNYPLALWDKGLYQALNWELGVPFKLKLGE
jgi:hypothetical protein